MVYPHLRWELEGNPNSTASMLEVFRLSHASASRSVRHAIPSLSHSLHTLCQRLAACPLYTATGASISERHVSR